MEIAAPAILVRKNIAITSGNHVSGCGNGDFEQRSRVDVAGLAPIEARMRDNNFQSANQESEEGKGDEPVRDAHETRVPGMRCLGHWRSSTNSAAVVQGVSARRLVLCALVLAGLLCHGTHNAAQAQRGLRGLWCAIYPSFGDKEGTSFILVFNCGSNTGGCISQTQDHCSAVKRNTPEESLVPRSYVY